MIMIRTYRPLSRIFDLRLCTSRLKDLIAIKHEAQIPLLHLQLEITRALARLPARALEQEAINGEATQRRLHVRSVVDCADDAG